MLTEQEQPGKLGPEVVAIAKRRRFTAKYKRRILREYESTPLGQRGAFVRREGLYSSYIEMWRKQAESGEKQALEPKKRGRKKSLQPAPELKRLRDDNERLKQKLNRTYSPIPQTRKNSRFPEEKSASISVQFVGQRDDGTVEGGVHRTPEVVVGIGPQRARPTQPGCRGAPRP